jgi:hypothetical protein
MMPTHSVIFKRRSIHTQKRPPSPAARRKATTKRADQPYSTNLLTKKGVKKKKQQKDRRKKVGIIVKDVKQINPKKNRRETLKIKKEKNKKNIYRAHRRSQKPPEKKPNKIIVKPAKMPCTAASKPKYTQKVKNKRKKTQDKNTQTEPRTVSCYRKRRVSRCWETRRFFAHPVPTVKCSEQSERNPQKSISSLDTLDTCYQST